jgi:hypothetical protein
MMMFMISGMLYHVGFPPLGFSSERRAPCFFHMEQSGRAGLREGEGARCALTVPDSHATINVTSFSAPRPAKPHR